MTKLDEELLLMFLLNRDFNEDHELEEMEEEFYGLYGYEWWQACVMIDKLLPLCQVSEGPLTDKVYCGFADKVRGLWLAKVEEK